MAMSKPVYTAGTMRWARFSSLLINEGTLLVRKIFEDEIKKMDPPSLREQLKKHKRYLCGLRHLNSVQRETLYPPSGDVPDSAQGFDILLLDILLRELCRNAPHAGARVRLLYMNDNYGHIANTELSEAEFDRLWEELTDILVDLGGERNKISARLHSSIDPELEKQHLEMLEENKKIKDRLKRMEISDRDDQGSGKYISRFKQNYEYIEYLAKGGFGIVMKARNQLDNEDYAIKRVKLPTRQADRDKKLSEVRALAKLDHPNIVRYYGAWDETPPPGWQEAEDNNILPDISSVPSDTSSKDTVSTGGGSSIVFENSASSTGHHGSADSSRDEDRSDAKEPTTITFLYIKMELCKPDTLATWMQQNTERDKTTSENIIHQIAKGLQYIHDKGFIHRDLKPSNIFFSLDGKVKIGDFGLVTAIRNDDGETCTSRSLVGTDLYISPEQLDGRAYDHKTDIFSLGVIMFELLYPMASGMERAKVLPEVREQQFPEDFIKENADLVRPLLDADPQKRPDAGRVINLLPSGFVPDSDEADDQIHNHTHAVCKIEWPGGSGTGFLIGKREILTCSYVLKLMLEAYRTNPDIQQYTATFYMSGTEPLMRFYFTSTVPLSHYDENLDYTILELDSAMTMLFCSTAEPSSLIITALVLLSKAKGQS